MHQTAKSRPAFRLFAAVTFGAFLLVSHLVLAAESKDTKAATVKKIKQIFMEVEAAHRSGDVEVLSKHVANSYEWWGFAGGPLEESTIGIHKEKLKAEFKAGLAFDWKVEDLRVKLYGNSAVTTCVFRGKVTLPGNQIHEGAWRDSNVWINQRGEWKIVHSHVSPLVAGAAH